MRLDQARNVFCIGIAGSGMSGLAHLLREQAKTVTGVDESLPESQQRAFDAAHKPDLLIYSDAVAADHPLRAQARQMRIPSIAYHEALGQFASRYITIAVAGTHGKSSTTAFLAHICIEAGLDPTVLVGAQVPSFGNRNARLGQGRFFIVEADEYRNHFLTLTPAHAIITTIDFDHPDYFGSLAEVRHSFQEFVNRIDPHGMLVTHPSTLAQHSSLKWPANMIAVSDDLPHDVQLNVPGQHMRDNAALAVAFGQHLGVPREDAVGSLKSFPGLSRRFEELGYLDGMRVISDYGHHPVEIQSTLRAARNRYPGERLLALFEPHMVERLVAFGKEFAQAFTLADGVLLYPVFAPKGREPTRADVRDAVKAFCGRLAQEATAYWQTDEAHLRGQLEELALKFSVAIAFSAGVLDSRLRSIL